MVIAGLFQLEKLKVKAIRQPGSGHPEKRDEYLNKFIDIELAIHAHGLLLTLKDSSRMINSVQTSLMRPQGMSFCSSLMA